VLIAVTPIGVIRAEKAEPDDTPLQPVRAAGTPGHAEV